MTIEARIAELTLAVDHLAAVIEHAGSAAVPATKPAKSVSPSIDAAAPKQPMQAPAQPAKALTYDDVKVPFLALVKKNRDLALATLKPFGLDSLKPAKPEQFAAILAALNNALAS